MGTAVDTVINTLLLEMRGSFSCGGQPIMEFRGVADLMDATAGQISDAVPPADELAARRFKSCAVVGNSGSLLGRGLGAEINAHDAVIRFNAAPTRGFEADVGVRTTIRVNNVDHIGYSEPQDKLLIFALRNAKDAKKYMAHVKQGHHSRHKRYAFNPEFWCHVWDWVARRKSKPSSGLAGVILALRNCQAPVHLYGFQYNSSVFHYFDHLEEKVTKQVLTYHPLPEEAFLYRQLHAMGRIMLHEI